MLENIQEQPKVPNKATLFISWKAVLRSSVALLYASILAALPVASFLDRSNYLVYASNAGEIFSNYAKDGILELLSNEPLWLIVNAVLGVFLSPENVIRAIIFFSAFATALFILKSPIGRSPLLALLALLFPALLKNFIIHIRQGLGIGFFLLFYQSRVLVLRTIGIILSGFIHSSFVFISSFWLISGAFHRLRLTTVSQMVLAVPVIGVVFSFLPLQIASILGARQSMRYMFADYDASGLGLIFWLLVLGLFVIAGQSFVKVNILPVMILVHYLTSYFIFPPAARVLESGLPLILIAVPSIRVRLIRFACYGLFITYFVIRYLQRAALPGFGWFVGL